MRLCFLSRTQHAERHPSSPGEPVFHSEGSPWTLQRSAPCRRADGYGLYVQLCI